MSVDPSMSNTAAVFGEISGKFIYPQEWRIVQTKPSNKKKRIRVSSDTINRCREINKAIEEWLQKLGATLDQTHLCMEATGPYSEILATSLVLGGWQVSVVNPARIKGFSQSELARNKTDRADAALLARFCAAMRPSLLTLPPYRVERITWLG